MDGNRPVACYQPYDAAILVAAYNIAGTKASAKIDLDFCPLWVPWHGERGPREALSFLVGTCLVLNVAVLQDSHC
jgi:hypothetical protein